jgi:hypothetical protein
MRRAARNSMLLQRASVQCGLSGAQCRRLPSFKERLNDSTVASADADMT